MTFGAPCGDIRPSVILFGGRYQTTPLAGTYRIGLDNLQWGSHGYERRAIAPWQHEDGL